MHYPNYRHRKWIVFRQCFLPGCFLSLYLLSSIESKSQVHNTFALIDSIYKTAEATRKFNHAGVSCDTFYYTNHVAFWEDLDDISQLIANRPVIQKQMRDLPGVDSITLSPVELQLIRVSLSLMKKHTWPNRMFADSKMINSQDVDALLTKIDSSDLLLEKKLCFTIYAFSRPIFFRDSSWCIFLRSQSDILTREGDCSLYYLENGEWKRYAFISRWLK